MLASGAICAGLTTFSICVGNRFAVNTRSTRRIACPQTGYGVARSSRHADDAEGRGHCHLPVQLACVGKRLVFVIEQHDGEATFHRSYNLRTCGGGEGGAGQQVGLNVKRFTGLSEPWEAGGSLGTHLLLEQLRRGHAVCAKQERVTCRKVLQHSRNVLNCCLLLRFTRVRQNHWKCQRLSTNPGESRNVSVDSLL